MVPFTIMPSDVLLAPIISVSMYLKILVPRVETLVPRDKAKIPFNFKLHPVTSIFSCLETRRQSKLLPVWEE